MVIAKKQELFEAAKKISSLLVLFLAFLSLFAICASDIHRVYAETVPQLVRYQGVLKEAGVPVADGQHDVVFRIYDSATGGTVLWTGTHTVDNGNPVQTVDGIFSVLLGSGDGNDLPDDLFTNSQTYLGVTVGSDTEMVPRQQTGAAPYALNAKKIDGVGLATTTLALGDLLYVNADGDLDKLSVGSAGSLLSVDSGRPQWVATTTLGLASSQWTTGDSSISYTGGNVGIGTTDPTYALSVAGGIALVNFFTDQTDLIITTNGEIVSFSTQGVADKISFNGIVSDTNAINGFPALVAEINGGILAGFDDDNALYSYADGGLVVNSSGNVGIGTTTPGAMLAVAGSGLFGTRVTASVFTATSTIGTSTFAGRVGVGTTTPGAMLAVQGTAWVTGALRVGTTTGSPLIVGDVSGNARGIFSVDIQSFRNSSTHVASGQEATAVGLSNTVSGSVSVAVGSSNTASASYGTAIGYGNSSAGTFGTAIGTLNSAGTFGTAIGYGNNLTSSSASVAVGSANTVSASFGTAIGYGNSTGTFGIAIGYGNASNVQYGTAIGYLNTAGDGSFAAGVSSFALTNSVAIGNSAGANVANGVAIGNNSDVLYANSIAIGANNAVSQYESIAVGNNNVLPITGNVAYSVSDKNSIFGFANLINVDNNQSSSYVAVHGNDNTVHGKEAVVMGSNNTVGADNLTKRVVIGSNNSSFGANSVAIGSNNQLQSGATSNTLVGNNNSGGAYVETHIFGGSNTVTNSYVNVFGYNNYIGAYGSQVFGTSNSVSGQYSTTVGYTNGIVGNYSTGIGYGNSTTGEASSSFGFANNASANWSSAFGYVNTASGVNSVAFGNRVTASASGTTAIGFNFTNSIADSLMIGPNKLAAATILATGEFRAPFFTATSTTGTSAFAGRVGIGTVQPRSALHVVQASTSEISYMVNTNTGTDADVLTLGVGAAVAGVNNLYLGFFDSSTENGSGDRIGYISGNGSGGVSFTQTSDRRLKEEIVDSSTGLGDLLKIKVRDYNLKTVTGATVQGFIAQELYEVYPYAVVATDNGERDLLGNDVPWGVDYGRLTPILVKSIQDQQVLIGDFANANGQTILDMNEGLFVGDAFATVLARFDAGVNTITDFVATHVTAAYGTFGKLFADEVTTDLLCVRKADSSKVCFTGEELEQAVGGTTVIGGNEAAVGSSEASAGGNDAPVETVPGEEGSSVDGGDVPQTQSNDPVSTEASDTESSSPVSSDTPASDSNITVSDAE